MDNPTRRFDQSAEPTPTGDPTSRLAPLANDAPQPPVVRIERKSGEIITIPAICPECGSSVFWAQALSYRNSSLVLAEREWPFWRPPITTTCAALVCSSCGYT